MESYQDTYYRVVSDISHGAGSIGLGSGSSQNNRIGPGTYWTPRWDAVQKMLISIGSIEANVPIKIYKSVNSKFTDPPKEHELSNKGYEDYGEQVLVKHLEPPVLMHDIKSRDEDWYNLIQKANLNYKNYSRFPSVQKDGKTIFIYPNNNTKSFDLYSMNTDGYSYAFEGSIDQDQLSEFLRENNVGQDFDPEMILDYAIMDWRDEKPASENDKPEPTHQRRSTRKPFDVSSSWYKKIKTSQNTQPPAILIDMEEFVNSVTNKINRLIEFSASESERLAGFSFNDKEFYNLLKEAGFHWRTIQAFKDVIEKRDWKEIESEGLRAFQMRRKDLLKDPDYDMQQLEALRAGYKIMSDLVDHIQMNSDDVAVGPNSYSEEEGKRDIERLTQITYNNMEKIRDKIQASVSNLPSWNGSAIKIIASPFSEYDEVDFNDGSTSAQIEVGENLDGGYAPAFTIFADSNNIHIDDLLEGGDTDFFYSNEVQSDYFSLVSELKNPGSSQKPGKILTLYTARPTKDRQMYQGSTQIPSNLFLTNNYSSALGLARDLGGGEVRDVWEVRIDSRYLIQTLDGMEKQYQVIGNGMVPVQRITLIDEGSSNEQY